MKILGLAVNKINNIYNENKKAIEKKESISDKDSIEISSIGKSLSSYSIDNNYMMSDKKLESIRRDIKNGTYSKSSTVVAKKIIDNIKGREI